ncbi:DEAD/DEAH box helicase family protein, partial [bacterium]|nr:DEAD/DEAH box helicase family protein [bacterium]
MTETKSIDCWIKEISRSLSKKDHHPLEMAARALEQHPGEANLLTMAGFAAIAEEQPESCLRYLRRLRKHYYISDPTVNICKAIALAQQGKWPIAQNLLKRQDFPIPRFLLPPGLSLRWLNSWISKIEGWKPHTTRTAKSKRFHSKPTDQRLQARQPVSSVESPPPAVNPLARLPARIPLTFVMSDEARFSLLKQAAGDSLEEFRLRLDFARLSLFKGFDDLLCLSHLDGVKHYWYQIETTRKVLKQFRGRVLLADEVGLGKTIEAGMVLKEYLLRGMAERVLILVPPSLVGQWAEEMAAKFGLDFITTHDPLLRKDAPAFWSHPRIIASIAVAKRPAHFDLVAGQDVDLVIVDEAHHLKNRRTKNWKLVDALKKRFLLLLSATPVQNNLVELYNLLTLLKPGIFKTEKEFRAGYMLPGKPRVPANREQLQRLMRDVMIRNTRALVDVRLPPRQATTLRVEPSKEEKECYALLSDLIRARHKEETGRHRLALHHLLESAGSSPVTASFAIHRYLEKSPSSEWQDLYFRYTSLSSGAKVKALFDLLKANPLEKKMIFVRFSKTLDLLNSLLRKKSISFARFDGGMSGPQKDAAIEQFRAEREVLLCTETGGEGRNVQFCNTIINFDLPWNPQTIEQRIGRIHRIGQKREVFIFNLATKGTVEDQILRILDEKINMFELVVGEIQSIMG